MPGLPRRVPHFLYDRRLLGLLSRVAETLQSFLVTTIGERGLVPGVVFSIQSFGSLLKWQPHIHMFVMLLGRNDLVKRGELPRRGMPEVGLF